MDTKTGTLTEFLLARIAEDEQAAAGAQMVSRDPGSWWVDGPAKVSGKWWVYATGEKFEHREIAEHVGRHDPARVLAECQAKRRIVDLATQFVRPDDTFDPGFNGGANHVSFNTLRALAAVYAGHPDYRDEWA